MENLLQSTFGDPYLLWITAFFFYIAAMYLTYKIRSRKIPELTGITIYLYSTALFFFFIGLSHFIVPGPLIFFASFLLMLGASFMTRFPLKIRFPGKEKIIFRLLVLASAFIALFTFVLGDPMIQVQAANLFAFLFAGLFTIGFILYSGFQTKNRVARVKSVSVGGYLGLCCIVSHGLLAFQLFSAITFPLLGLFVINIPLLFAILSPITFLLLLLLLRFINKGGSREKTK